MKSKKLFIIVLSILVFTSCKNNTTNPKVLYRVSDIVGDWKSYSASFTITGNGWIYLTTNSGTSETYISGWDINGEILEGEELLKIFLTVNLTDGGVGTLTLTFNSASNCTATLQGNMETFTKL